ncbi:MAG: hypothetical protein KDC41_04380, partial [Saprospiraceae bacterium]|nr:hypothetical protein [Saprospiraceae bacterium]
SAMAKTAPRKRSRPWASCANCATSSACAANCSGTNGSRSRRSMWAPKAARPWPICVNLPPPMNA